MSYELFIARRLKLDSGSEGEKSKLSLNVAQLGIILAIVVMILSITIVGGFKKEITNRIYQLDSHIKVTNAAAGIDDNVTTVNSQEIIPLLSDVKSLQPEIESMSLIAEKSAIFKTDSDFCGIVIRGVDSHFKWQDYEKCMVDGRVPLINDTANVGEVIVSKPIADKMRLKVGDRLRTYFIDSSVKTRNLKVVGVFRTDFDEFDKIYALGNIAQLQQVNGWNSNVGNYVGINLKNVRDAQQLSYEIFMDLAQESCGTKTPNLYNVTNTFGNNAAYFGWLDLLDMNVVIILVLMAIVSAFTLIAALLMIVLERIKMIGTLKTLGATNSSIRKIFIYLTQKLIVRALVVGNLLGIGLSLVQQHYHILKLDAEAYYMTFVPISIDWLPLVVLNVGIVVMSYLTLIAPSYIISSIKPTTTLRYE